MLLIPNEIRPSPIHGIGVFILAPVKKGEVVWRFDSRIDRAYSGQELAELPPLLQRFIKTYGIWHKGTDLWMLCGDNARFFNHAGKPSTTSLGIGFAGDVAAYDLPAGAELTSDYRTITDETDIFG